MLPEGSSVEDWHIKMAPSAVVPLYARDVIVTMANDISATESVSDNASSQKAINIVVAILSAGALVGVLTLGLYYWNRRHSTGFRIPEAPIPLQGIRPPSRAGTRSGN